MPGAGICVWCTARLSRPPAAVRPVARGTWTRPDQFIAGLGAGDAGDGTRTTDAAWMRSDRHAVILRMGRSRAGYLLTMKPLAGVRDAGILMGAVGGRDDGRMAVNQSW